MEIRKKFKGSDIIEVMKRGIVLIDENQGLPYQKWSPRMMEVEVRGEDGFIKNTKTGQKVKLSRKGLDWDLPPIKRKLLTW